MQICISGLDLKLPRSCVCGDCTAAVLSSQRRATTTVRPGRMLAVVALEQVSISRCLPRALCVSAESFLVHLLCCMLVLHAHLLLSGHCTFTEKGR